MEAVHERCCGLDVHKASVVACRLAGDEKAVETFGTTTRELLRLGDWLAEVGCTHVAMESTGSYWKPVYNLLEGRFELVVVNTRHLKLVPGRKSDVKDAEWIAELLQHGLLRGSYVPGREERELRELTRYRTKLTDERTAEVNRVQKVLEGANIKLSNVVSSVVGVSARAILEGLVGGVEDTQELAALARGKLRRATPEQLQESLLGLVKPHQRFMLAQQLRHVDELSRHIDEVSDEIERRLAPFAEAQARLRTIPGVGPRTAQVLLAEVGSGIEHFGSAAQLASWVGICPGLNESAGKNRSGRTAKGNQALKVALVQAANAAGHTQTYPGAQYRRLRARLGPQKAAVAVAHTILIIAYHVLRDGTEFRDLGFDYFARNDPERTTRYLKRRLEQLGYRIIPPAA
jgi:transposase